MRFAMPQAFVWLLWIAPMAILFLFAARRRRRKLARFAESGLLPPLVDSYAPARARRKTLLWLAGFGLCILALPRPQWGFHWEEVHRRGIDIIVLLDTSNSMLAEDVAPSRIARAKLAVQDMVRQLTGDRVGLVAFAGSAFLQCPLTLDYDAFLTTLQAVDVGYIPRGGTNIGEAVNVALRAFGKDATNHRAIILITDGENLEGSIEKIADDTARGEVKIFAVGIGTPEGELIPIRDETGRIAFLRDAAGNPVKTRLTPGPLQQITVATGGIYVQAGATDFGLKTIYEQGIAPMSPQELSSRMQKKWEERFQIPLLAGILLLGASALLTDRRRAPRRAAATALAFALLGLPPSPLGTARAQTPPVAAPPPPESEPATPPAAPPAATATAQAPDADAAPLTPEEARRLLQEGNRAFGDDRLADAAAAYRAILERAPDDPRANYNLGLVLYRQREFEQARAQWDRVQAEPALIARARYNAGNALVRQAADPQATPGLDQAIDLYAQALLKYQQAIELDRADSDARRNFEIIQRRIRELEHQKEEMARITEETRQKALELVRERRYADAAATLAEALAKYEYLQQTLGDLVTRVQALAQIFAEDSI